ncbi:MAG: hypothetical protein AVDCRST_MAG85-653, partial [uncultured Solirubrobacteraceae bacterium]
EAHEDRRVRTQDKGRTHGRRPHRRSHPRSCRSGARRGELHDRHRPRAEDLPRVDPVPAARQRRVAGPEGPGDRRQVRRLRLRPV